MSLRVVSETEEPQRQPLRLSAPPEQKPVTEQLLPILNAVAAILAIRSILALAGAGAFILAIVAALNPSWGSAGAALAYDLCVLCPFIAYAAFRRG